MRDVVCYVLAWVIVLSLASIPVLAAIGLMVMVIKGIGGML